MILCSCPRTEQRLSSTEPLMCDTCRGWIRRGRPLTAGQFQAARQDIESLLGQLVEDYPWALGFCYDQPRRGEVGPRGSDPSDPTGAIVSNEQRARIAASVALCGRFLNRAVLYLRLADEALGDAKWAADPRPPERAEGEWYPLVAVPDEVEQARAAQARRRARGEGAPA